VRVARVLPACGSSCSCSAVASAAAESGLRLVRFQGLCLTARIRFVSIFVGNLPFRAEQEDVAELFSPFGEIVNCALPLERDTGRKRGFAFVEMADSDAEDRAIEALQGAELMGRPLRINKAEPRGAAPRRGGGGNRDRAPGSRGWEDRSYGGPGGGADSAFEAGRTRRRRSGSSDSYGGAEG
jgi:RNA recognition motif-containing protein